MAASSPRQPPGSGPRCGRSGHGSWTRPGPRPTRSRATHAPAPDGGAGAASPSARRRPERLGDPGAARVRRGEEPPAARRHVGPADALASAPSGAGCGRPARPRVGSRSPVSPRGSPAPPTRRRPRDGSWRRSAPRRRRARPAPGARRMLPSVIRMSTSRRGVEPTSTWSPESGALRRNGRSTGRSTGCHCRPEPWRCWLRAENTRSARNGYAHLQADGSYRVLISATWFANWRSSAQDPPSIGAESAVPGLNRNLAYMNKQVRHPAANAG